MPGRLSSTGTTTTNTMGVYKLSVLDLEPKATESPILKSSFIRGTATTFMGRRFSTKVQPTLRNFLETPEMEDNFIATPTTDPISNSSSEDDSRSSHFTASSTRTSNKLSSDDDSCLRELTLRSFRDCCSSAPQARHSTASCTDVGLRQELRKKFHIEDVGATPSRNSFAMGHCSFRRELETTEDRAESLALWEEKSELSTSARDRVVRKGLNNPHSRPHGHTTGASFGSSRLGLEGLFRKPKKATSTFFNGVLSVLSFSTTRRSRKL